MNKIASLLLIISMQMVVIISSAQITNGLVAYYPCNGDFNDASGNANNGTVYGAVPGADRYGNATGAYIFNGVDNYVSIPDPLASARVSRVLKKMMEDV